MAAVLVLVLGLAGCAGTSAPPPAPQAARPGDSEVAVSDISMVTGKWAGVLRTNPASRNEDWVELTIAPDATYRYSAARQVGVLKGAGGLAVRDGTIVSTTQGSTMTGRLVVRGGQNVLKVTAVADNGVAFSADLTRNTR
jgi:hypothetical protein